MNNRGYMLVETLIVSVFIMSIFTLLYTNLLPLIGDYDRYKNYNTVEATYVAHWVRKLALDGLPDSIYDQAASVGYVNVSDCNLYTKNQISIWCSGFKVTANIKQIYLTPYSTSLFKTFVKDNSSYTRSFQEYIQYLPTYRNNTSKTPASGYYRVIVEYESNGIKQYGTMEVAR